MIKMYREAYIGIDLGGTFVKYGLVGEGGEIIEKGKVPTPAGCGYAETAEVIASAVRGLAKSGASVCGLGIGFEAYASATALIRQTKRAMEKDRQSTLWLLCNGDGVFGRLFLSHMLSR